MLSHALLDTQIYHSWQILFSDQIINVYSYFSCFCFILIFKTDLSPVYKEMRRIEMAKGKKVIV